MTHSPIALVILVTVFIILAKCLRLNMADLIGNLCSDLNTASTFTKPVLLRKINENLRGAMPAILRIARDAGTGSITVKGVNLPNPWANRSNTQAFLGAGGVAATGGAKTTAQVAGDYQFTSGLVYVAPSGNNWILLMDEMAEYVAPPGAAVGFTVSNPSGTIARLDFGTQDKNGDGSAVAFTTTLDYGMLSYCDLQVKVGTVVKTITTDYAVTNVGGVAVVTFVAAPATGTANLHFTLIPKAGVRFGLIYAGSPTTLKAAGTDIAYYDEIVCKDAAWVESGTGTISKTDVSVLPRP